jgi:D-alanyl-D-alanine carboxypeptidase/D-alanyl-D-alanine endopeptidase (penicillin-binding protein 7)
MTTPAAKLRCFVLALLALLTQAAHADIKLNSSRALVVDEATGQVLLEKNSQDVVPMASLTKLLTAMVVLDAQQSSDELITIETSDLDTLKHTRGGVPVGRSYSRGALIERALLTSDNHAASSLARHYPGGLGAFLEAARLKAETLGLTGTTIVEPTGLSSQNRSSAADLVVVLAAAATYPDIARITSQAQIRKHDGGHVQTLKNTNPLVGKKGWEILLSKTGFTNEAGRCVAMRLRSAGHTVLVVLLDAPASRGRTLDALNVHRIVAGDAPLLALPIAARTPPANRPSKAVRRKKVVVRNV